MASFPGLIDEVRIYNRALSASEISALVGDPNLGLVGYWKFDENSGTTAADSSGNGNTGTLFNGAGWTSGQSGSAVSIDGVDDFVKIKDGKISNSTTGTITAWVKANSLVNVSKIVCYGGGAAAAGVPGIFGLEVRQDGSNYYFSVINVPSDGSPSASSVHGSTILQSGVWYHVAVTSDGSSWKLYVNGVAETLTAQFGNGNTGKWFGNTSVTAPDKTYIGGAWFNGTDMASFPGLIDEVRIYNRALSASEVAALSSGTTLMRTMPY
jgi:concanavalin A-like lectin/glucanase superfamily protein